MTDAKNVFMAAGSATRRGGSFGRYRIATAALADAATAAAAIRRYSEQSGAKRKDGFNTQEDALIKALLQAGSAGLSEDELTACLSKPAGTRFEWSLPGGKVQSYAQSPGRVFAHYRLAMTKAGLIEPAV